MEEYGISKYIFQKYIKKLEEKKLIEHRTFKFEYKISKFDSKQGFVMIDLKLFYKLKQQEKAENLIRFYLLLLKLAGKKKYCYPPFSYIYENGNVRQHYIKSFVDLLTSWSLLRADKKMYNGSPHSHSIYYLR